MTVETLLPAPTYVIAGTGPYAVPHPYLAGNDLLVWIEKDGLRTDLTFGSQFTAAPTEKAATGDVTLDAAIATTFAGGNLYIDRATDTEQGWEARTGGREAGLEAQMDRTIMAVQDAGTESSRIRRDLARALVTPIDETSDMTIPAISSRANKVLSFDASGLPMAFTGDLEVNVAGDALVFETLQAALLVDQPATAKGFRTLGYAAPGDGGGSDYVKAASEPSHPGKGQSPGGQWWVLAEPVARPEQFSQIDGLSDSAAIQAADDYAAATGKRVEFFSRIYGFDVTVTKAPETQWEGVGEGRLSQTGTTFVPTANITMIAIVGPGSAIYNNGAIRRLRFTGSRTTYPSSIAISGTGGVRQQILAELQIRGFARGINWIGGGEVYTFKVFTVDCDYGANLSGIADTWLDQSHFGSGPSYTGAIGIGVNFSGSGTNPASNLTLTGCRLQVSHLQNMVIEDCDKLLMMGGIVDQSESHGVLIRGGAATGRATRLDIIGVRFHDNGAVGANVYAGLYLKADDGMAIDAVISGSRFLDRNMGGLGTRQKRAVSWEINGSGTIRATITGGHVEEVPQPFGGTASAQAVIHVCGVTGMVGQFQTLSEVGDAAHAVDADDGATISYNVPLTAQRNCALPIDDYVFPGTQIIIARTLACDGDFRLTVSYAAVTIADLTAPGTQVVVQWNGATWTVIEAPQNQYAAAATLGGAANWPNVRMKRAGVQVFDKSTGVLYIAAGASPTAVWKGVGGGDITPS